MKKILTILAFALLSGCASKPWSEIDGSQSDNADVHNYDIIITAVDGKIDFAGRATKSLDPGFHLVRVVSTKADRKGGYTYANLPIQMKPCMRYFVTAQHDSNKLNNKYWEVRILREEPIKSCLKLLKEKEQENNQEAEETN